MPVNFRRHDNLKFSTVGAKLTQVAKGSFNRHGDRLINSIQAKSPFDRGGYKKGVKKRVSGFAFGTIMLIYNSAPHAEWVEKGRKPGSSPPPPAPILGWVRRHNIGVGAFAVKSRRPISAGTKRTFNRKTGKQRTAAASLLQAQKSAAFAIGRKIGRDGIPGLWHYRDLRKNEAAIISDMVADIGKGFAAALNA